MKPRIANLLIACFNVAFFLIWGLWAWEASELWSSGWKFDAVGHSFFGFVWAFILLYWIIKYFPRLYIQVPKFIIAFIIISIVTAVLEVVVWEILIEWLLWDSWLQPTYFTWLAKAQKGSADTNMDIVITLFGSIFAMLLWWGGRAFYAWKWPNEAAIEAIEEARERAEMSAAEITAMQKEHRKQVVAKIKSTWEKIFSEK